MIEQIVNCSILICYQLICYPKLCEPLISLYQKNILLVSSNNQIDWELGLVYHLGEYNVFFLPRLLESSFDEGIHLIYNANHATKLVAEWVAETRVLEMLWTNRLQIFDDFS